MEASCFSLFDPRTWYTYLTKPCPNSPYSFWTNHLVEQYPRPIIRHVFVPSSYTPACIQHHPDHQPTLLVSETTISGYSPFHKHHATIVPQQHALAIFIFLQTNTARLTISSALCSFRKVQIDSCVAGGKKQGLGVRAYISTLSGLWTGFLVISKRWYTIMKISW